MFLPSLIGLFNNILVPSYYRIITIATIEKYFADVFYQRIYFTC